MSNTTCWTVIDAAAAGSRSDREAFAKSYLHAIHAYFRARWRESRLMDSLDDAVQEVFLECFRDDGPLARVDRDREGGFRPFLYGVVRNIALRIEKRAATAAKRIGENVDLARVVSDESRLSVQFDRAWALTIMRRAAKMQEDLSHKKGDAARRRVELLKLRFQDGIPIREIAVRWGQDPAILHREYAKEGKRGQASFVATWRKRGLTPFSLHTAGQTSAVRLERRRRQRVGVRSHS